MSAKKVSTPTFHKGKLQLFLPSSTSANRHSYGSLGGGDEGQQARPMKFDDLAAANSVRFGWINRLAIGQGILLLVLAPASIRAAGICFQRLTLVVDWDGSNHQVAPLETRRRLLTRQLTEGE